MHFINIEIENFGTIGTVSLPIADRGLVLVTGRNEDAPKASSNGAGKSLLLDAFCWCLWGRTIREDKDDDVVNRRVGKNCKVSVVFEERGKTFTVTRYRKHEQSSKPNDLVLCVDNTDISSASVKLTQEVVNNLLGFTFNTFCAMMPGAEKNAAQMTDSDVKELLENILHLTAISRARTEAEERLKLTKAKIHTLESKKQQLDSQESQLSLELTEYYTASANYDTEKSTQLTSLQNELFSVESEIALLTPEVTSDNTLSDAIKHTRETIQKTLEELNVEKSLFKRLEVDLGAANSETLRIIHTLKGRRDLYAEELEKAGQMGEVCVACNQTIDTIHKNKIQLELKQKLADVETKCSVLCDELNLRTSTYDEAKQPHVDRISTLQNTLTRANNDLTTLTATLHKVEKAQISLRSLEAARDRIAVQIVNLEAETSPYAALIRKTEGKLDSFRNDLKLVVDELAGLYKAVRQLEFWKYAFSPAGIRSFILDNVTPVLNERVDHYCKVLTDGEMRVDFSTKTQLKSGEWREKFNINIQQEHGGSSYRSNSKGERQRANLAICFAISDLTEMHSNKRLDFRFLDEPFENIDELGTDAVVSLLQEQQTKYPTIFVVTHQSHFQDIFPVEVTMVKKDGMSRLEEGHNADTAT